MIQEAKFLQLPKYDDCSFLYGHDFWDKILFSRKYVWNAWDVYSPPESDLKIFMERDGFQSMQEIIWKQEFCMYKYTQL